MKRWKVTLIAFPLLVAVVGIGSWQYRPQLKALGASALTRATTVYRAVTSRWGLPVPAALKHQKAGASHKGQARHEMKAEQKGYGGHLGHGTAGSPNASADRAMPSTGPGAIMVTPEKQQLMGVTIGMVERKGLVRVIRSVGTVEAD